MTTTLSTGLKLTANETAALTNFPKFMYVQDYGLMGIFEGDGSVWSFSFNDDVQAYCEVQPRSVPGIVSSLVKKGLVELVDEGTEDACTYLTDAGREAVLELNAYGQAEYDADKAAAAAWRQEQLARYEAHQAALLADAERGEDDATDTPAPVATPVTEEAAPALFGVDVVAAEVARLTSQIKAHRDQLVFMAGRGNAPASQIVYIAGLLAEKEGRLNALTAI